MDIENALQEYERVRKLYAETHPDRDFAADLYFSHTYWRDEAERWRSRAVVLYICCLLLVWVMS